MKTPMRVAKALTQLTGGRHVSMEAILNDAIFHDAESAGEMVVVRDVELNSLCEHHMLPFTGKAHIGYISDGRIIGLSKVARIVDKFARQLQVQERITRQVAQCLVDTLAPPGVAVMIEASYVLGWCAALRGSADHLVTQTHVHVHARSESVWQLDRDDMLQRLVEGGPHAATRVSGPCCQEVTTMNENLQCSCVTMPLGVPEGPTRAPQTAVQTKPWQQTTAQTFAVPSASFPLRAVAVGGTVTLFRRDTAQRVVFRSPAAAGSSSP